MEAAEGELLAEYVHPPANKIGVLVRVKGDDPAAARRLAMHVSLRGSALPERGRGPGGGARAERAIYENQADVQSKPEEVRAKIVEGRLRQGVPLGRRARASSRGSTILRRPPARRSSEAGARGGRVRALRARRVTEAAPAQTERPPGAAFHRVLLKLSGEALMGDQDYGLDPDRIAALAAEIAEVREDGLELAIVVGAGNIYRGMRAQRRGWTGRPRTTRGCSRRS